MGLTKLIRTSLVPALLLTIALGTIAPEILQGYDSEQEIVTRMGALRNTSGPERADLVKQLASAIQRLAPRTQKVVLASNLASLSTEGDIGESTRQQVAQTLADALQEQPAAAAEAYQELATLIRYEHASINFTNPTLQRELRQMEADDRDRDAANFTLKDMNGTTWKLKELTDKIVLVNFWATWCRPCISEMRDLDSLYRQYRSRGLVVLAISDEDEAKVNHFISAHQISYPILFNRDRGLGKVFHLDGIPRSFIYNRKGHLAAQAVDMSTYQQFLSLLSQAGLETE